MRKLLLALTIFTLLALSAVGVFATYTDTETSVGNWFRGSGDYLDLRTCTDYDTEAFEPAPGGEWVEDPNIPIYLGEEVGWGSEGSVCIGVRNFGNVQGMLRPQFNIKTNDENGLSPAEEDFGDTGPQGEIAEYVRITVSYHGLGVMVSYPDYFPKTLAELDGVVLPGAGLKAYESDPVYKGDTMYVQIDWSVPYTFSGPVIETDICTFDIAFSLAGIE